MRNARYIFTRSIRINRVDAMLHSCWNKTLSYSSILYVHPHASLNRSSTRCVGKACSNRITSNTPSNAFCSLNTSKYSPHVVIPIRASMNTGADCRLLSAIPQRRRTMARISSIMVRCWAADPGPRRGRMGSKTSRSNRASSPCVVPVTCERSRCQISGKMRPCVWSGGRM